MMQTSGPTGTDEAVVGNEAPRLALVRAVLAEVFNRLGLLRELGVLPPLPGGWNREMAVMTGGRRRCAEAGARGLQWTGTGILLGLFVVAAVPFLVVWSRGQRHGALNALTYLYALLPLAGGVVGLARVRRYCAGDRARPWRECVRSRDCLTVAAISAGLLLWSAAGLDWMAASLRGQVLPYPSLADIGFYGCTLCLTAGIWITYEGVVDDFLDQVRSDSFFLTSFALLTVYITGGVRGGGLKDLLSANHAARYLLDLVYPFTDAVNFWMLFRLIQGRLGRRLVAGRAALRLLTLGLLILYAADLAFDLTTTIGQRDPTSRWAFFDGQFPEFLYAVALLLMALAVVHFPLETPLFRAALPRRQRGAERRHVVGRAGARRGGGSAGCVAATTGTRGGVAVPHDRQPPDSFDASPHPGRATLTVG